MPARAISLPGDLPFDLFGDAITESLASALAALADARLEVYEDLIRNPALNEYVRWAAATAMATLAATGQCPRPAIVDRLCVLLREAMAREDLIGVQGPVHALVDLCAVEAYEQLREPFAREMVNPLLICWDDVGNAVSRGEH